MATQIAIDEKIKQDISEPGKYKVLFLNDDQTPMEWVIDVLKTVFKHSSETAEYLTLTVHNEGSAVVGVYTYEVAEQKLVETTSMSRANGFPLKIKMEKE